eukprot:TRINITY_DN5651_c0_g1_i1.p1 TRINITY_DN5651_c0_g1~~TRINITY_DN5651_c0_g1_i1.p1  ORF type:complete len:289 (+),score=33.56 TRINITY_DN5651_c0_g1_i1:190-1056(+)
MQVTVEQLKELIYKRTQKFYPSRQRLTLPLGANQTRPTVLEGDKRVQEYFSGQGDKTVVFKDLGPQVSYQTLFILEYLGPLVLYPLFYYFPRIYSFFGLPSETKKHPVQTYALISWTVHYAKRILETVFVHRFSHATSPVMNVFRNCAYYWGFGVLIAYYLNHPLYTSVPDSQMYLGFGIAIVAQLANFHSHLILKNLRSKSGTGGYQIPYGFLFNYITCANYFTEIVQWLGFNIATQTAAGYFFLTAATYIMTVWAIQKHKRLRKTFDGKDGRAKYPRRWVILPPLL